VGHMHHLAPKGTTGGDQWLEYKGKGSVQAPGDPNRSHLYHVLHQTGDHKVYSPHPTPCATWRASIVYETEGPPTTRSILTTPSRLFTMITLTLCPIQ
jgi:hypothetical protein